MNIDCMNDADLEEYRVQAEMAFCADHGTQFAFVDAPITETTETVRNVLDTLTEYALFKRRARDCRLRGMVGTATSFEHSCDRLYQRLPHWAQW